jgi:hypothetical protein
MDHGFYAQDLLVLIALLVTTSIVSCVYHFSEMVLVASHDM